MLPCPGDEPADPTFESARQRMVEQDIAGRGISDPAVLEAMRHVPRHRFVPEALVREAYADHPLPIGADQTISQPYIVALMTELAHVEAEDRVLEIGTGSGYQAAVLAEIASKVYSIEILEELSRAAASRLAELGYRNLETRVGDGYRGWPEEAPFDAILVTAAPPEIPGPLLEQLAPGGRLVIPVGRAFQELLVVERTPEGLRRERSIPVRFVPMTGEAQKGD
ncbi:MAG: protein-L-isoaspartate(D-aspartate) O-methyltransferase [Acidobacteriota bacterium]